MRNLVNVEGRIAALKEINQMNQQQGRFYQESYLVYAYDAGFNDAWKEIINLQNAITIKMAENEINQKPPKKSKK